MEKLRCRRRTPSKLRLLLLTKSRPFFLFMRHKFCDAPGDQMKASNKISDEDEDSKQEPESLGWGGGSRL